MNKIDAFKKSVKESKKKLYRETVKLMNPGLNSEGRYKIFENIPNELMLSAVVQIKYAELYDSLDKSELMEALAKKNIQFEDFNREVERFRTTGYVAIDKYIDVLVKNNKTTDSSEKFENLSSYVEESTALNNTFKSMNKEDLITYRESSVIHNEAQLNEIIQTVYDNRIMPYITSEKTFAKDVVNLGKTWIDEDAKLENRHR